MSGPSHETRFCPFSS